MYVWVCVCTHVLTRVLQSVLHYQREELVPPTTLASHTGPQPGRNFCNLGQNWGPSSTGVRARSGNQGSMLMPIIVLRTLSRAASLLGFGTSVKRQLIQRRQEEALTKEPTIENAASLPGKSPASVRVS